MKHSPPKVLILLLVLVAAAGAFLVWSASGNGDAPPSAPENLVENRDPEAVTPIGARDGPPSFDEGEPADYQPPEGLSRIELRVAEASGRRLVVQVWDGQQGVAAAEASVFVLDGFEGPELTDPFAQHWSALAEDRGQRFETDPQGRVELPPVKEWAIVTAQRPGAYGFAKVGPKHRDVETITLHADETVTVRVTNGEDHPVAGAPVGVVQRVPIRQEQQDWAAKLKELEGHMKRADEYLRNNPEQREAVAQRVQAVRQEYAKVSAAARQANRDGKGDRPRRREARKQQQQQRPKITTRVEVRARRQTDEDGIAVFRHFQVYRQQARRWWPPQHVDQFEAVLLMPLQQPESRAFSGRPVPEETIELRLPPTASLALRTVDRDGRPFTHPVHANLRMLDEQRVPWAQVQVRKEQNEESIVFPFVGLGLRFTAQCRLDDEDFRWRAPEFAGPGNAGERLTVDLVVAPDAGMLYGRLFDDADDPLAGARLTFLINSHMGRLEGEEVTLDDAGRFHLPYLVQPRHRPPFRLEIRRDDVRPTAGLAMMLPTLPAAHVTDLGEMRLDAFGQIAHGIAVDDRGLAVVGARVQLQRERDVGAEQPRLEFVDEAFTVTNTDAEGQYELFGELEPGRYRLRAEAEEHFPFESRDLRAGERIDLTLDRKSRILGTVLRPDWMQSQRVRVRMRSVVDPQQQREDQIHDYQGNCYVFFDWVKAGIYDLTFSVRDFPDPFLRVDGLELLPGQQDLHPRLRDLDLSAYLSRFEVLAFDENGQKFNPDRPLLAQIARPDGRSAFVGFPWKNGRIELFSASSHLEVIPLANGYRADRTVLTQGRSDLRFLTIPPVELQVPGLKQLVGSTQTLMLMQLTGSDLPGQLEKWDGGSGRMSGWWDGRAKDPVGDLGNNDIARMKLMCDGRYRVAMLLGRGSGVRPERVDLTEVDVRLVPGGGPERVVVNAELEPVQQALARLAQRLTASQQNGK